MHDHGLSSKRTFIKAVKKKNPQAAFEDIRSHVSPLMELIMQGVDAKIMDTESNFPIENEMVLHPELSSEI